MNIAKIDNRPGVPKYHSPQFPCSFESFLFIGYGNIEIDSRCMLLGYFVHKLQILRKRHYGQEKKTSK